MSMKKRTDIPTDGLYQSNFKSKALTEGNIDGMVKVGNTVAVDLLFSKFKDSEPIEFVTEVKLGEDHPVRDSRFGEKVVLTKEWAQSFAKACNAVPKPVYVAGHENVSEKLRAIPDGYIVGAEYKEDSLYLRNRLLNEGKLGATVIEQTQRELKAGILSTSTGDFQKRKYVTETNKAGVSEFKAYVTESMKGQSNSIVEDDMGAADVAVMASFRVGDSTSVGSEVQEKDMEVQEVIKELASNFKSKAITSEEISKALGMSLVTVESANKLSEVESLEKELGMSVAEYVSKQKEESASLLRMKFENAIKAEFKNQTVCNVALKCADWDGTEQGIVTAVAALKANEDIVSINKLLAGGFNYRPGASVDKSTEKSTGNRNVEG